MLRKHIGIEQHVPNVSRDFVAGEGAKRGEQKRLLLPHGNAHRPAELKKMPPNLTSFGPCSMNVCVISQNHRMVWFGRDLKDHLVPTPLR